MQGDLFTQAKDEIKAFHEQIIILHVYKPVTQFVFWHHTPCLKRAIKSIQQLVPVYTSS